MKLPKDLPCPTCQKKIPYTKDNAFRPFCSERCKLIDLGEWANNKRSIPGAPIHPDQLEGSSDENE